MGLISAIGGGLGLIGGIIGGNSKNKAAGQAADAQTQVARENNALARDIYSQNKATLSPFVSQGSNAGNYLNAFLGLVPNTQTVGGAQIQNGNYIAGAPNTGAANTLANGGITQAMAQNAFGSYLQNSDYAFQQATGNNNLAGQFAGAGAFQSGAALQDLEKYKQNLQSGYRNEYLGQLANQQGIGLGAASAQAGVGQNYTNTVSANNQNAADALSNAALIRGNNNPFASLLGGVGGLLGGLG